jgi:tetratricopeptide (TPR) repeat protein
MKKISYVLLILVVFSNLLPAQEALSQQAFKFGETAFARGQYERAIQYYSKAIDYYSRASSGLYLEAYYKRGLVNNLAAKYEDAIKDFDKCIENNYMADEAKAKKELALTEQKKVVKTKTKTDFGSGGTSEFTAKQFYDQGFKQYLLEDYEKALANFTTATEWSPSLADAYALKANSNFSLKNYKDAIKDCNKAIEKIDFLKDTDISDIFYTRGSAYNMLQKFEDTLNDLNEAINANSKKGVFYTVRGSVKYNMGNKTGACEDWNLGSKNGDFINASKLLEEFCK